MSDEADETQKRLFRLDSICWYEKKTFKDRGSVDRISLDRIS